MKKITVDYFKVLFGNGVARGISFLTTLIIARSLGPEEFGKFSIFFVIATTTYLIPQAFDITFVRYAKNYNVVEKKKEFLKTTIFLKSVYSILLIIFSQPLAEFLSTYCFHKPEAKYILILAFITGVFLSFLITFASVFQEKEKFGIFSFIYAFYTILIFFSVILLKLKRDIFILDNIILLYFSIAILVGTLSIFLLFKKTRGIFPLDLNSLRMSFSLGKWILAATTISYLFYRLDFFFLTRFVQYNLIGVYSVAKQLTMVISLIAGSASGIFLPKASTALKSQKAFNKYKKEAFFMILLMNLFIICIMVFSSPIINILYGERYIQADNVLKILLIGWFAIIIYLPFSFLFYTLNDSKSVFFLESVKLVIGLLLLYFLVPVGGIIGASFATTLALFSYSILSFLVLKRKISRLNLL